MYEIWANLGLLFLALIAAGILWFILLIVGKAFFEDFLVGIIKKFKRKKKEDEDDFYVY
jgi:hypothetical protein